MINAVPTQIAKAARQVTLKHPNSMDASIYRKVFTRTNPTGETMGGIPTMGGMGVLTPEDEDEYTYELIGDAKMLITSHFDGDLDMTDRTDSFVLGTALQEALIEPIDTPPFTIKKYDMVAMKPGGDVVIGFEILALPSVLAIYPYATKYVIAPRDDLHNLEPFASHDAA